MSEGADDRRENSRRENNRREEGGPAGGTSLPEELRALGRGIRVPDVDGESMAERVLARILAEHVPVPVAEPPGRWARARAWARRRWRALAAALSGLLVILVLTPPVRAAVADWFGFGGVAARVDPMASGAGSPGGGAPECTDGTGPLSVLEAAARAGFDPLLPSALGKPAGASVSADRRILSVCWHPDGGRTIRIDEFRATPSPLFYKTIQVPWESARVHGEDSALWFGEPHELRMLLQDAEGRPYAPVVRTAGPTLVWQKHGELTLRLEGVPSKSRAQEIADSTP
ncbi:hypothetical protein [Streptomyces sp. BPTC-684]|uniref:hypothetical protein n=1 Tax=Streptomyces sp. BPTC-684 TaxID=3043734 RepID=UPI0024B1A5A4|nr:hypothetical protein [Streptomyces sp. BPTC-684]WHM37050.1 hypothetical protein QIY60_09175 [Streptomyces sp. BPTC-684]